MYWRERPNLIRFSFFLSLYHLLACLLLFPIHYTMIEPWKSMSLTYTQMLLYLLICMINGRAYSLVLFLSFGEHHLHQIESFVVIFHRFQFEWTNFQFKSSDIRFNVTASSILLLIFLDYEMLATYWKLATLNISQTDKAQPWQ